MKVLLHSCQVLKQNAKVNSDAKGHANDKML